MTSVLARRARLDGAVLVKLGLAFALWLGLALPAWAAEAINPVFSAAAEGSKVICGGAGPLRAQCSLRSIYVTTGATAGFLMTFNQTTVPADGAVTPRECIVAPANQTTSLIFNDETYEPYNTGLAVAFSTTGCFTKTASATAFFKVRAQ